MEKFTTAYPIDTDSFIEHDIVAEVVRKRSEEKMQIIDNAVRQMLVHQNIIKSHEYNTANVALIQERLKAKNQEVRIEQHPHGEYRIYLEEKRTIASARITIEI